MPRSKDGLNEQVGGNYSEFMESLEPQGVYLSGPIRCVQDNGSPWRNDLIEDYPEIDFNNPLDNHDPEVEEILNDPIHENTDSEKDQVFPSEYVTDDKIQINKSEAVFVGLPEVISTGTKMEMMYAYMRDIPVFVWVIDDQEYSGWTYHHSEFISNDRDEVISELRKCFRQT